MDPARKYPILASLLKPFPKRQRKTLSLIVAAIVVTGQARSFAIATTVARWLGTRLDSAVNRFYRLLKNERVDELLFVTQWARQLARGSKQLLLAVDWTEWHHDLRLLVASVVVGKRGIPLWAQGFKKLVNWRSQNARENTFARVLADCLGRAGLSAILLCDRGFRRVSWLALLQQLRLGFVVRLMDDVHVTVAGERLALADILLTPGGRILDLGVVPLRADGAVEVRVIGYWTYGAPEPWWIATSEIGPAYKVLQLYDRRMTVEEQFRDVKGQRFGIKLYWTQFRDPAQLARFVQLLAVALLLWYVAGMVESHYNPSLRLVSRKKGPRQSFITIGLRILAIERPPRFPLTARWVLLFTQEPTLRRFARSVVGGK